jgi:outer membrane receptor protein involved in Fe transport
LKRIHDVPVPIWQTTAQFNTRLALANGRVYGADLRLEYNGPRLYGFVGYGYGWTQYEAAQDLFSSWFGEPVQRYHPPHDRRHQINAVASLDVGGFTVGTRWQLGSGLPFTRPIGFDEWFDFRDRLDDVHLRHGTTRVILDKPYQGRLPLIHRLDLSVNRTFQLPFGNMEIQAGAINLYDQTNIFYYDVYTHRRVDQLPFAPYASLRLEAP